MRFSQVESAFHEAVARAVFPGAVVLAARGEEIVFEQAFGCRSLLPQRSPLTTQAIFDIASLTKPLATSLAVLLLVSERRIALEDQAAKYLAAFAQSGKESITVAQLLAHTSGLPAWKPFFEEALAIDRGGKPGFVGSPEAKKFIIDLVQRETPIAPPGTRTLYSDLGFITLGALVEKVAAVSLDDFCRERIFRPLGVDAIDFTGLAQPETKRFDSALMVPTEDCSWRHRIICGEVHDDNAYAMGGVAGHAGLFASARAVHEVLAGLRRCLRGDGAVLSGAWLRKFLTRDNAAPDARFTLGWDTPSPANSASGSQFSPHTVGHLGFTGTSFWWDLERDCYIILLTNRVHPTRANERIREFRPRAHDLIMKAMFA
jgi:CubicO group peptidase (beta-lactamase class C family)